MTEHAPHDESDRADGSEADGGRAEGSVLGALGTGPVAGKRSARPRRRRMSGCVPILLVLAVLAGLGYVGVTKGLDVLSEQFGDPDDFAGPGRGTVAFVVNGGDTATAIGNNLVGDQVVASVEAFTDAAAANPDSSFIQPGTYSLKREMKASDVVDILVDPSNIATITVAVPEGLQVRQIVDRLVESTDFKRRDFQQVLDNPGPLGLPPYADGNAEGYLFPATYSFGPQDNPTSMLTAMVARWQQAADDLGLVQGARALDYTPHELMTIASLVESEGRGDDMPKIARVIYNRLSPDNDQTGGLLQIDATVIYALGENPGVALSAEELDVDSPYNTRRYPGLPPGPIEAPGEEAIEAALDPAQGDWFYYVTVNLETGETKFAATLEEFNRYKAEYADYCTTSDAC